jgi:hypothetical protein
MPNLQTRPLPFLNTAYKNTDEESLVDLNSECFNGFFDGISLKMRPGLTEFCTVSATGAIQGIHYWQEKDLLIVASENNIYKVDSSGTVTDISGDRLNGGDSRVHFASDSTNVYIADGGKIIYSNGTANTQFMADADAPTVVTYLTILDGYLIALNKNTQKFYFSSPTNKLSWAALDFASVEGDSDLLEALTIADRQILLVGSKSTEWYFNDGSTPFAANVSRFLEEGTIAEQSLVKVREVPIWLSTKKEVVSPSQGSISEIVPFGNGQIQDLTTVSDAIGFSILHRNVSYYGLYFPTEDKTLMFDLTNKRFFEWSIFDTDSGTHKAFLASSSAYHSGLGVQMIGSRNSGKVYKLDKDSFTDGTDQVRFSLKTGHITHGITNRKKSNKIIIRVKSGQVSTAPLLMVRYKNDNGLWQNERTVSMKTTGNNEFFAEVHRLGLYRSRQWEFSFANAAELSISSIEETFEVLEN